MTLAKHFLAFACLTGAVLPETATAGESVGVLALHDRDRADVVQAFEEEGCEVSRQGALVARQGNLEVPQGRSFGVFLCDTSVLGDPDRAGRLLARTGAGLLLEGAFEAFEEAGPRASDRQYLIKVSVYNNIDPVARQRDLGILQEKVIPLPDRYSIESAITVDRAFGLRTPDEVSVISYETPAAGERFREQNPGILEAVGRFNKTHLVSWVYLVATAD